MSISSILNIAKNAMSASQMSVQVTSHNISNVNTEGYSRQEAQFIEEAPSLIGNALLGNGVKVNNVIRYYDKYLEKQIEKKNTELEEQRILKKYSERLEGILNEDSTKLTKNITEFFNGWQELSADPQSIAIREGIIQKGQILTRSVNYIYNGLKQIQIEANENVKKEVDEINRITDSIAALNTKIFEGSSSTSEANDYKDQMTVLLKKLAGKMDITSFEDGYGRITILTSNGKVLVEGGSSWKLGVLNNEKTGFFDIGWSDLQGNLTEITEGVKSGSIKAYFTIRDEYVVDFIEEIDTLAKGIMTEVNKIHKEGYSLNHIKKTPEEPDGIPFFKELNGNYAKDMAISDMVKGDIKNITSASEVDDTTGKPIGNGVAAEVGSLIDSLIFEDNTATIVNFTSSITNRIGQLTAGAKDLAQYSEDTMRVMEKQRESVSGVSIDEEMANLIKFQYAFQASARLFTVADELFKSILEAVR